MFGRKPKVLASAEPFRGALSVDGIDVLENAVEVARLWVENNGPATCVIQPGVLQQPEIFGMLMVDCIRHAARAYAQSNGLSEEEALARIWEGLDMERDNHTTGLDTVQDAGKSH